MPSAAAPYIATKVALTKEQAKKLAKGHPIQLKAAAIKNGNHPIYLTKTQINHLQKAAAAGKGARISFSGRQVHHHLKMGGGFWSDFANGFRDGFSAVINGGAKIFKHIPILKEAAGPLETLAGLTSRGDGAWNY